MMPPCPTPMWIMGMRTSRTQGERGDGRWRGAVMEWVLHYSSICPHSSLLLARNTLISTVFLLGKRNIGTEHSYKSALSHDWQRPNVEWEQFGQQSLGKEGEESNTQARIYTGSLGKFQYWLSEWKPRQQEFGKFPQAILICSQW